MGWIGPVLTGVSALAGLFGGSRQRQNNTVDKTVMPTMDPQQQSFRDYLINAFRGNLEGDRGFGSAYTTGGLQNILDTTSTAARAGASSLAARGLGRTTAGGYGLGDQSYRAGSQISSFLNNVPIVLDQRRQNLLKDAGGFFSTLPTGTHTTGYDNTSVTAGPTSPLAGFAGGATQGLAGWLGQLNTMNILDKLYKQGKTAAGTPSVPVYNDDWYSVGPQPR